MAMTRETKATAIAAGLVAIISMGFVYVISDSLDVKTAKEGEKGQLETDISTLEAKVAKTEALTIELENLKANFAQYIKILPSPEIATQQRLMELVNDKSVKTTFGLERFDLKKEIAAAAARRTKTAFQEVEIALTAKATFEQFLKFLNSLERHESFVRVNSFTCTVAPPTPGDDDGLDPKLSIALNISTFRYDSGGK